MSINENTAYDIVKRCLDIVGAIFALILAAPIFIISAISIKLDGGPVLFTQKRVGQNGRMFNMLKLRTMIPNAHKMEIHLRHEQASNGGYGTVGDFKDPRITKIGALLRLLNFDELPQLFNVLKGEMSLIGPRPVPYEESLFYGEHRDKAFSVRPGLTGYWQIKRKMSTDYDERVQLDCHYVQNRNLLLDAYILAMTPVAMLTSDYNSVTKPLPPPVDGILISEHARIPAHIASRKKREEPAFDEVLS